MDLSRICADVIQELFDGDDVDAARAGGIPREPYLSAGTWQHRRWEAIMRRMRQWGVPVSTIGTEQPQPAPRPRLIPGRRGQPPRLERWITASNQPDIQTVDPRTGRRVAVEVDTDPEEVRRKMRVLSSVNPDMRAAFELIDRRSGQPIETHVWNPLTRRFSRHAGGVRRQDVLDFEW